MRTKGAAANHWADQKDTDTESESEVDKQTVLPDVIEADSPYNSDCDNPIATSNPFKPGYAEVEGIVDRRQHKGILQYKVKWKGWNNRYNCWRDEGELECSGLIDRYNDVNVGL